MDGATMHRLDQVLDALDGGRSVTGVGLAARLELSAHALNNEGSLNNATLPRQVDVVAGDEIVQVNAISGDTIKHAFVDYLRAAIADRGASGDLTPICEPCRLGDPNRLNSDTGFQAVARNGSTPEAIISELIRRCAIDDTAGLLVTQGKKPAPRRSAVQFGWELGIPDHVRTGRYTHVKLVPANPKSESAEGSNLGQNIFTRPASSGRYAFVGHCDLDRIGRNDVTLEREISDEAWRARAACALTALLHTVALPGGAQRNTQFPHLHGVTGALAISLASMPPVIYSPLADDFAEQMARVASAFGRAGRDHFVVPFADLATLGDLLSGLSSTLAA